MADARREPGRRDTPRDTGMKWMVIVGAIVVALLLIGLFTDWFGLYGIEQAPDMSTARPTP